MELTVELLLLVHWQFDLVDVRNNLIKINVVIMILKSTLRVFYIME